MNKHLSGATRQLATFAVTAHEFPELLTSVAKRHILDTVACMMSGARGAAVQIAGRQFGRRQDAGRFPVPGWGVLSAGADAAWLAGLAAHADDFDDTSEYGMRGHPSAPVLSGLLPLAFERRSTGHALIEAFAVGIELACKLGRIMGEAHTLRGWHTMSTIGAVATSMACSRLRELDLEATSRAIGIAASTAGGLVGNFGTNTKALHRAVAARNGYHASALGGLGFDAQPDILERTDGFIEVFGDPKTSLLAPLAELGLPWELLNPGIAIKIYPACSCTHLAIDGMLELVEHEAFKPDEVEEIRCFVRQECLRYLVCPNPCTAIEAKFSIEYCMACALIRKRVAPEDFTPDAVGDPVLREILPRVKLLMREQGGDQPDVEVRLRDGRRLNRRYDNPRGSLQNPLSWDDLAEKFSRCAGSRYSSAVIDASLSNFERLETIPDVVPMLNALVA